MARGYKIGDRLRLKTTKQIYEVVEKKDGFYFLKTENYKFPIAERFQRLNFCYERVDDVQKG